MNTTSRMQDTSGLPAEAGAGRDFVAVDDSGEFSYHRSERDLIAAFEYVGEAACIIDRSGSAFRLALDPQRHLMLGPSLGPAEFHWLRQAWLDVQNAHPESHRLRRFFPITKEEVVSDVFEILTLEHGPEWAGGSWALVINGIESYPANLEDIDHRLRHQDRLEHVRVRDPFGHIYRPLRHRRHWYLPASAGFNLYIEIPAPSR
ncbi:hypothetical protein [Arthrobacter sp. SO3]|uniref:hypothetical protein n=1 Tax=Arthrobacter sp. SO3 TaxID=1897057 RepID=UPI001CFF95B0|nr:hypothetical protein [Arthrobacter sp. SO3]MCB5292421.1 hypothetical protein [Arthrobacter sp. SO3]